MKKEEALQLAPLRSKLLCEYITQILKDEEQVTGEIAINSAKIDDEKMITFDIQVPCRNFSKHLNTGITTDHIDLLVNQLLNDLVANFMEDENMGVSRYFSIRGGYGMKMDGVVATNNIGSKIDINFLCRGKNFQEQIERYNNTLDIYVASLENKKSI